MNLLKAALNTINNFSMLAENDNVLIGLSGGPDSVCLSIILNKLKEDFGLTLSAVYVDHGLRPDEVEHEKSFCKKLCSSLGITFFSKSVDVRGYAKKKRLSKQEAARELRYQVFEEIAGNVNATKISLAHNADDQAETFLMRLLRGSGPKGLSCIPPVRGKIIRPLIEIGKGEIENFLIQNPSPVPDYSSLPFVVDSSNCRTDYLRNWIRHKIMPELRNQNPALVKTICRVADILHEEDMYLDTVVNNTLMKLISRKRDDELELFLVPLENMKKPVLRRVIRWAINETRGLRGIDFDHIEEIIRLVKKGNSGDMLNLPKGLRAVKRYSTLLLTARTVLKLKSRNFSLPGELLLEEAGMVLKAEVYEKKPEFRNDRNITVIDFDKLSLPLKVRKRQKGDFFYPFGFGRRKKLQDFFVDEKIPREERDKIPVVLSGDDVIWVAGYRADERFRVTDRTEKFLSLIISKNI